MEPKNLLFIFSDEHTREITGCYGNSIVKTPNIDALAARGTTFDNAYTNCPICVPARASLATGRYVSEIGYWDNAHPYEGRVPGWGHRLIDAGHEVVAIGKLHYRSAEDRTGWSREIDTLHVVDGLGDLLGCYRHEITERGAVKKLAADAGPGDSTYIGYDTRIADQACEWLAAEAPKRRDRPWVLFLGFVLPHFPLIAPPEYYAMYPNDALPWPRLYDQADRPTHPVLEQLRIAMNYDKYFTPEKVRIARSAYFGMVSYLDHNIGRVLRALEASGLADDTRVLYTTDHGDNIGHRGLWGKSVMYEESTALPMVLAGADVPAGQRVSAPTSLVDVYQTVLDATGVALTDEEREGMPGHSLLAMANGDRPERTVLSEYHAAGSCTGFFMIRHGRYKYVHYVGHAPQLFDLEADPQETRDLAADPAMGRVLDTCEAKLRALVDPEAVNARAFRDQDARIAAHGGLEAVRARGDFGYTPAPGQTPLYD
ncbi:MAG: sulfatase-like hydrolase/transferase [Ectothiorhodospiraceae bacterium]|nr:sulfatase-like hydrolase/transferase [Chromatiales bacterium]MCP5156380.1 sulfatase-like hydrolase/transferase [Ectothiorhodospiraceae bacterium]